MSDTKPVPLETHEQQVSYGFGLQFGQQLVQNNFDGLDINAVFTAMHHVVNGSGSTISESQLNTAYEAIKAKKEDKAQADLEQAKALGLSYLTENAKKTGVTTTESGVQFEILTEGTGEKPGPKSAVRTHYHGTFLDGKVFDSSIDRGEPAEFGVNEVIPGWTEILQMMPVGSKWRITIPYQQAYGANGSPPVIPPCSTLLFELELIAIIEED